MPHLIYKTRSEFALEVHAAHMHGISKKQLPELRDDCAVASLLRVTQIKKGDVLVTVDGVEVKNMEPSQLGATRHESSFACCARAVHSFGHLTGKCVQANSS